MDALRSLLRGARYGLPIALVGVAVVYVATRGGDSSTEHASLPDYAVASGSELVLRGDPSFEIVVRPSQPVRVATSADAGAAVVAYVFAIGEGEPNALDAAVEMLPGGEVRIRGRSRALDGVREVRVVLGAPSDFRRFDDALARAREGKSDAQVRVVTLPIVRAKP